jgi:hypothetical protein
MSGQNIERKDMPYTCTYDVEGLADLCHATLLIFSNHICLAYYASLSLGAIEMTLDFDRRLSLLSRYQGL